MTETNAEVWAKQASARIAKPAEKAKPAKPAKPTKPAAKK